MLARTTEKLLTIAIPTYNRAGYLDLCLSQIGKQVAGRESSVELIVSNNCSTDRTEEVVRSYQTRGLVIRYVNNSGNLGAERNVVQCYRLATGRHVWIFSDDDVLLDGAIDRLWPLLEEERCGVIYLNSYVYQEDYLRERPGVQAQKVYHIEDPQEFVRKVSFWLTFLSGNVVNRRWVEPGFVPEEFLDTNLPHVGWILSALFRATKNAFIADHMVAVKGGNTGGYRLCEVFGTKLNRIFDAYVEKGVDGAGFRFVNDDLLKRFFPPFILSMRRDGGTFLPEDHFASLHRLYRNNPNFWIFVFPMIRMPLLFAKLYHRCLRSIGVY